VREKARLTRHKICPNCKVEFCDISNRNSRTCCSDQCSYEAMVNTRRENGSYVHTEEWKKNLSETFQKQVREGTFVVRGPLTEKGRASMIRCSTKLG
jgi:hydrogenase maturation factor HypF (carbamoyltransferase family)